MKSDEIAICGLEAVRARFAQAPESIRRLFFDYATGRKVGIICKALAQSRKVYRCVEPAELEKVGGTIHHGGIVAVVEAPPLRAPTAAEVGRWARERVSVLVLDRIGNAHNLGAIARTAAFFGVPVLVLPDDPAAARPNDAAFRVAEGGLEHLDVRIVPDLPRFLRDLSAAGFEVVGAAVTGARMLGAEHKTAGRATAVVLGNEEKGLSDDVRAACTRLVTIPGNGKVESLNVSVAAAVLIWNLLAQNGRKTRGNR